MLILSYLRTGADWTELWSSNADWFGLGLLPNGFGPDWIPSNESVSYSVPSRQLMYRGRCLISDPVNSKRRGTDAIRAEALLIDFSERVFISLRKSTIALLKFSLILLQSAIPRTLAKNVNRDIPPVCNRGDGRKWVYEISMYNFIKQKKWRNMANYFIMKNL